MKLTVILLIALMFFTPIVSIAQQQSDAVQAIADAKRDGKNANTSYIWFPAGCVLGVVGIVLAGVYTPPVPAEKLLGKSPEYVAYYTSTYQKVARDDQLMEATLGCVFSTCLGGAVYGYLLYSQNSYLY
ncbi:MAG: conotoxin [Candidatus Poribacteria bacterium]|nr:conotoxin [Candidatus Poribacteria bacterium]